MRSYGECPECHDRQLLTQYLVIRKHQPKKDDGN